METMTNCHLAASLSWPGCPSAFERSCSCCPGAWCLFLSTHSAFHTCPPIITKSDTSLQLQTAGSNERNITSHSSIHLAGEYYSLELRIIAWEYPRATGSLSWKGCSIISSSLSSSMGFTSGSIAHRSPSLCLQASRHDEFTALLGDLFYF